MSTPYIGSKISLISRLDIRYEGTLYSVDPLESTISLSQVRSFGTEDRPAPVSVPGRAEVYEFIIFKASDIKDLIVCEETPKDANVVDITYDPAIVSVSKPPAADAAAAPKQPHQEQQSVVDDKKQQNADDKASQHSSSPQPPQQQQKKQQPPSSAPPPYIPPPIVPSSYKPPASQPSYRAAVTGSGGVAAHPAESLGGFGQRPQRSFFNRAIGGGAEPKQQQSQGVFQQSFSNSNFIQQSPQQQTANRRPYYQPRQPLHHQQGYHPHPQQQHYPGGQVRGASYQWGINRQPYHRNNNNNDFRAAQQFHPLQQPQQRYDGDFDFEKANQQFQTIGDLGDRIAELGLNEVEKVPSIRGNGGGGSARGSEERSTSTGSSNNNDKNSSANKSPMVPDSFYDKNSSFFDNISCDALEREEGKSNRVDWKKERITNQETFGQMAVRTMMYYQRGCGGRGGAGPWSSSMYHRGSYNFNNNHHHHHHNQPQQQYYQQQRNHHHSNHGNNSRFVMQRQYHPTAQQQPQQLQQQ